MKALSVRIRVILVLLAGVLILFGTLFSARAKVLPHGRLAPVVLVASLALAALPTALLVRYQILARRILRARVYKIPVETVPRKPDRTFLGEGFVWSPAETRLLLELPAMAGEIPQEARELLSGDWLIHGIGAGRTRPLFLPNDLLNQHLFLMGAPGSGKTRALELLIEQAVARGDAVVVIDPKGDEGLLDRTYDSAVRHAREGDFRVFAMPYPYQSARYNPLADYVSPSDIADRIASVLPKRGESEPFRNFAWQFVSTVATALDAVGERVSLKKLEDFCLHNTWLLVRLLMKKVCPDYARSPQMGPLLDGYRAWCAENGRTSPELDALIAMASLDRQYYAKISGALRTILSKLTSRAIGYLLCPGDVSVPEETREGDAPVLSWRAIDNDRLVVYFYLGSLIGQDSASAVARMALADLMSYVGKKYAYEEASGFGRNRLTVIVDEVADALAPESVNILNKARGAGLSLVMAGQSLADLEVALGGAAEARRALANVGSMLALRAANPDDAAYFSDKVGTRPLPVVTRGERYEPALFSSGRRNIADFAYQSSLQTSTRNEPLLPTWALDRLARFHYFGLWGGELYKGVIPLLETPTHLYSPVLKRRAGSASTPASADPEPAAVPATAGEAGP